MSSIKFLVVQRLFSLSVHTTSLQSERETDDGQHDEQPVYLTHHSTAYILFPSMHLAA